MFIFKYPEERDIIFYYAGKLADHRAAEIFANEVAIDEAAALHISEFFWKSNPFLLSHVCRELAPLGQSGAKKLKSYP